MEIPEWEKSKENVQPRKQGRNVDKLNKGLCARRESDIPVILKAEKEEFEVRLRSQEGDDPLSVWCEYIAWTEENYPSGGKGSHLSELLTSCVKHFDQVGTHKDDKRLIEIWITFAGRCKEPQEIYRHMNRKCTGVHTAAFYKAWALSCEDLGQSKMADKIFVQGIEMKAEPIEELMKAREEFQTRTCRQLMENMKTSDELSPEEVVPQRQTLGLLASSSKGRVGYDRVQAARPGLATTSSKPSATKPQKSLQVFTDENDTDAPTLASTSRGSTLGLPDTKENVMAAGRWSRPASKVQKTYQSGATFDIHTDEQQSPELAGHTAHVGAGLGLSVKKGQPDDHPFPHTHVITTTGPDEIIQELPMYNKSRVYAGLSEFSFEELRAIKWRQAMEKKAAEQESAALLLRQRQSLESDIEQQRSAFIQEMHTLQKQMQDTFQKQMQDTFQKQMQDEINKQLQEKPRSTVPEMGVQVGRELVQELRAELSQPLANLDSAVQIIEQKLQVQAERCAAHRLPQSGHSSLHTTSSQLKTPNDKNDCTLRSTVSSKRHRTPDTTCAKRSLIKNSPLGITQDYANVINVLYNQTLSSSSHAQADVKLEETAEEAPPPPLATKFAIFGDDASSQPPASSVYNDNEVQSATESPAEAVNASCKDERPYAVEPVQSSSAFSVFASGASHSAFKKPAATSGPPQAGGFIVFVDETSESNPQIHQPSSEEFVKPVTHPSQTTVDQENRPVLGHAVGHTAAADKGRLPSATESMEYNTDFDIAAKFRAVSTPFISNAQLEMSDVGVSEIRREPNAGPRPKPINPIDFAATQVLSPICEQSRESASSSSRSTVSSDGVSTFTAKMSFDSTRRRTRSIGEQESHTTTGSSSTSEHMAASTSRSKLLHSQQSAPALAVVNEESGELLQRATPVIDTTFYKPPELTEAILNTTVFIDPSNPFSEAVQSKLLRKTDINSYVDVDVFESAMPKLKVGNCVQVADLLIKLESKLGIGGFATAFKGIVKDIKPTRNRSLGSSADSTNASKLTTTMNGTRYEEDAELCVKIQKPPCPWELYICRELRQRFGCMDEDLARDIETKVMNITCATFYNDASLLVNDLAPLGSVLNLVNAMKARRMRLTEELVMYITIELLHITEVLHRCKIIHGDIKPDNILFLGFPEEIDDSAPFEASSVKLIDFGRGIDMSKFPPGTTFTANNETEGFACIEMKTERPWTYQTDLFGILGTIYTLIDHSYMRVEYRNDEWTPSGFKLPRYYKSDLWLPLFQEFMNVPSCDKIPCITTWREKFETQFSRRIGSYGDKAAAINAAVAKPR